MTQIMALLAALLTLAAAPAATTLAELLASRPPLATVDRFVALGRTIDLMDQAQVRAAIGPVAGLPTRRSQRSAFAGYTTPHGEIVYNPDQPGRIVLLVTFDHCLPLADILARLNGPDFTREPRRITVALYTDIPYRTHPGMAFTYLETPQGCVASLGLVQRTAST